MRSRYTRLAVLVLGLGAFGAACGKYSISNIRSLKAFQDANNHYRKNEYQQAIEYYEEAIRLNPDLGFAYFFLGNSYDQLYKPARKGEPLNDAYLPEAVKYYEMAIEKLRNSEDPQEQQYLQLTYEYLIAAYGPEKLDDFQQAEPLARELIALAPDEPQFYQALAAMHEARGEYEQAETLFQEAIDVRPNDGLGHMVIAGFYNRQGEFERTMEAFGRRAELEPNNPEAWHTIGTFYYDKVFQDKTLARSVAMDYVLQGIEAEDKALAINPDFAQALIYKNILLRQQANLETDPAVQARLIEEADELRERGMALMEQMNAAAGSDDGTGGTGSGGAAGAGSGSGSDDEGR